MNKQHCDFCDELTHKTEEDKFTVNGKIVCENCFDIYEHFKTTDPVFLCMIEICRDIAKHHRYTLQDMELPFELKQTVLTYLGISADTFKRY